ncbi:unnamed protein product [Camellia sinensis]
MRVTPPWVVLLIGAAMNFSGYFMIWLAVTGRTAKPHVWQLCLYIWIGADSQAFANTGSLITCVKNFPQSRGIVSGLLKGFVGLSGAIMTQIYHALYGNNSKSLIFLIGWLPAVVSIVFLPTIRLMKVARKENEHKIFYNLLYVSLGLAGFLMVIIVVQSRLGFSRAEYGGSALVVFVLLFAPLIVVIQEEFRAWKSHKQALNDSRPPQLVIVSEDSQGSSIPKCPCPSVLNYLQSLNHVRISRHENLETYPVVVNVLGHEIEKFGDRGYLAIENLPRAEFESAQPPQVAQLELLPTFGDTGSSAIETHLQYNLNQHHHHRWHN